MERRHLACNERASVRKYNFAFDANALNWERKLPACTKAPAFEKKFSRSRRTLIADKMSAFHRSFPSAFRLKNFAMYLRLSFARLQV